MSVNSRKFSTFKKVYGKICSYMALKLVLTAILTMIIVLNLYHFQDTTHWMEKFSVEVKENVIITTTISTIIISLLMTISVPIEPILVSMAFFTSSINGPTIDVLLSLFICFNATQISAFLTVIIVRYCFPEYLREIAHQYKLFSVFNEIAKERGFLLVSLVRLSLFLPFVPSNCLLGLTDISFFNLFLGNFAVIPAQISLILFGVSIYDNNHLQNELNSTYIHPKYALLFFSFAIFSMLVLIYILFQKYREINQKTELLLEQEYSSSSVSFRHIDNL
ncbi:multi-pass transmembrane [Cryptosporidium sp. chipmunk genotype I]|uniref:multi-pass transmembrane n=1 Tax=Cryptosporidium sp. chipmunk genotype I TaxID=1280935 RepID=UPI00351A2656|nr:multi-pass transmembrane [Cryptosporidium sp. chipmunk genotype I]